MLPALISKHLDSVFTEWLKCLSGESVILYFLVLKHKSTCLAKGFFLNKLVVSCLIIKCIQKDFCRVDFIVTEVIFSTTKQISAANWMRAHLFKILITKVPARTKHKPGWYFCFTMCFSGAQIYKLKFILEKVAIWYLWFLSQDLIFLKVLNLCGTKQPLIFLPASFFNPHCVRKLLCSPGVSSRVTAGSQVFVGSSVYSAVAESKITHQWKQFYGVCD